MLLKNKIWCCVSAAVLLFMTGVTYAGQLFDRDFTPKNYPYSDHRDYSVYVPSAYDGNTPVPMVMVLHGCKQTRDTVFDEFGWDETADQYGIIVVAPDVTSWGDTGYRFDQCWGYWLGQEIHQGGGEVEDLHRIGLEVEGQWQIDPERRHIVGLSSGGFMANAAAVTHNEYWSSAGVHSGGGYMETASTYSYSCLNPRESSGVFRSPDSIAPDMQAEMDSAYKIPVMLIHSVNDCTVGYGVEGSATEWGGATSNREAWLKVNGGAEYAVTDCSEDGIDCTHKKYGTASRSTVEVVSFNGLKEGTDQNKGHYWTGGKAHGPYTRTRGPEAAKLFMAFFNGHPRRSDVSYPAPPTGMEITAVTETSVSLKWQANSESDLAGYNIYRNNTRITPDTITETEHTNSGLQRGTTYSFHITAISTAISTAGQESHPSGRVNATTTGCTSYATTINDHVAAGRAYKKETCIGWWCWLPWVRFNTTIYYAVGTDENLGTNGQATVTLYTTDNENYSTTSCEGG